MHVSDHLSLGSLDDMIRDGNNSTFNGFKNYFLINVPSDLATDKEAIAKFFAKSPLSYNSLTFAFVIKEGQYGIRFRISIKTKHFIIIVIDISNYIYFT